MLDFFIILSKGGIVLWCIQTTSDVISNSINTFLKSLILKENIGIAPFIHESHAMRFHMDNEFELIYIVGYQKLLKLNYVDKFLTSISLEFRDKYKEFLRNKCYFADFNNFKSVYEKTLFDIENACHDSQSAKTMRQFQDSEKSKKSVSSMIVNKNTRINAQKKSTKLEKTEKIQSLVTDEQIQDQLEDNEIHSFEEDAFTHNRQRLAAKLKGNKKQKLTPSPNASPQAKTNGKRVKESRKWDGAATGAEAAALDYSSPVSENANGDKQVKNGQAVFHLSKSEASNLAKLRGTLRNCDLNELDVSDGEQESDDSGNDESMTMHSNTDKSQPDKTRNGVPSSKSSGGLLSSVIGSLRIPDLMSGGGIGSRKLTRADLQPCLEQLRDRLIGKNVAAEIAVRLCDSVAERLEGAPLGTFERTASRVQTGLTEACTRLLASGRRVDVLRDALDAKANGRPYTIVFCGVNGVGKSTNLAKIAFWLTEKGLRVLIAACDTFRAGAVEQLRTHVHKLNYIHPPAQNGEMAGETMVELYEKGYGKDAAAIAMSAINFARDRRFDVVLVDTAGRMQDNEPLMRAMAKLITVNQPDLVLFVGEALVGNEAVDQLVKFNQSLADYSNADRPRGIDGIVLTKFDTIDDKVGAAISMAYISGQPIVFVGCGQTYADLRQLSVNAVVKALMK